MSSCQSLHYLFFRNFFLFGIIIKLIIYVFTMLRDIHHILSRKIGPPLPGMIRSTASPSGGGGGRPVATHHIMEELQHPAAIGANWKEHWPIASPSPMTTSLSPQAFSPVTSTYSLLRPLSPLWGDHEHTPSTLFRGLF